MPKRRSWFAFFVFLKLMLLFRHQVFWSQKSAFLTAISAFCLLLTRIRRDNFIPMILQTENSLNPYMDGSFRNKTSHTKIQVELIMWILTRFRKKLKDEKWCVTKMKNHQIFSFHWNDIWYFLIFFDTFDPLSLVEHCFIWQIIFKI